jgi:ligand-binding sensor domain-containing protein
MNIRYLTAIKIMRWISCVAYLSCISLSQGVYAGDYRFNSLTIADGLTSEYVNQTLQQRNGFIWFATNAGASRYDGNSFRHFFYSPGEATHITNNVVIQIFEDRQGNVWILTEGGLNKVNSQGNV